MRDCARVMEELQQERGKGEQDGVGGAGGERALP